MKATLGMCQKIVISEVGQLDDIAIFIEDSGNGRGSITIGCWDNVWSSYWNSMGSRSVSKFFTDCDNGYLVNNLSKYKEYVEDYSSITDWLKSSVVDLRKNNDIDKEYAEDLWHRINTRCINEEWWIQSSEGSMLCREIIGDDWWYAIPTVKNSQYIYLSSIIDEVKLAIKQFMSTGELT